MHYCNSAETENNIKPSPSKQQDAVIKTLPKKTARRGRKASLGDKGCLLSFSLSVCFSLCFRFSACLCVWERESGDEVTQKEGKWYKTGSYAGETQELLGLTSGAADVDPQSQAAVAVVVGGCS